MAWIEGSMTRTFTVRAPYDAVVEYFCSPEQFQRAFSQLERAEQIDADTWRWVLKEKNEKGIRYQADYQVRYVREEAGCSWKETAGNMRTTGKVICRDLGSGRTEIEYAETLAPDLPIPRLAAKVFGGIVGREVSAGIGDFLERSTTILETEHGAS